MNTVLKIAAYIFLPCAVIFSSCKKETSCEGCATKSNKPPIAVAGPDQVITLPIDSVLLDGRSSSDPDGSISNYLWTKISGPSSFNIIKSTDSITRVRSLVVGIYQFELKVTDNGGLIAKDTVQVSINNPNSMTMACNSNMLLFGHLSHPATVWRTAAVGSKIFFGAFYNSTNFTDVYDTIAQTWSTIDHGFGIINVGNKLLEPSHQYPNNQESFEVFNVATDSRTSYTVPEARIFIKHAVTNNKVVFAGGSNPDSPYYSSSKRIDIYNDATNSWSTMNFNEARGGMSVVGLNNKIYFAGGNVVRYDSLIQYCDDNGSNCYYQPALVGSKRLDIFDMSSNTWSAIELNEPRNGPVTAIVGNKILFAGGGPGSIDIYDVSTNTMSTLQVNPGSFGGRVHTVGNKVLFTGDSSVGIYDALTNSWSTAQMSEPSVQTDYLVAVSGNKVLFFTVFDHENDSRNIDIYNASTNTWCHGQLSFSLIRSGIIVAGDRIYIAGGTIKSNPNGVYDQLIDDICIFDF